MPSGAKKRKAAKKKKEKDASSTHSATHALGGDGVKGHDEKGSDGGEVSSSLSQDPHGHQHRSTEGEEEEVEKIEGTMSAQSFASGDKSMEVVVYSREGMSVATEDEGAVLTDGKLKPKDDVERKNISIEHVESLKESHNGASHRESGSSSNSSSDEESRNIKTNIVVESKEEAVLETSFVVHSFEPVDFMHNAITFVSSSPVEGADAASVETAPLVDSDKVCLSEEAVRVPESDPVENFVTSDVVESGLKKNAGTILPLEDQRRGVSSTVMDSVLKNKDDEISLTSYENAAVSSDAMGFPATENESEDKLLLSFNAPGTENGDGAEVAECVKDSEDSKRPERSDSQPQVARAPQTVQTTSWKSCCGLFELLTGSNR